MDIEGLREDLRLLVQELGGQNWVHPDWRTVRKLAGELDHALYWAQKHSVGRVHKSPDLGVSVSDGVGTKDRTGG